MTVGELVTVVKFFNKRQAALNKEQLRNIAYGALYGAYYSRVRTFPNSLEEAFPGLFGEEEAGQVDEGERAFLEFARRHNEAVKQREKAVRK